MTLTSQVYEVNGKKGELIVGVPIMRILKDIRFGKIIPFNFLDVIDAKIKSDSDDDIWNKSIITGSTISFGSTVGNGPEGYVCISHEIDNWPHPSRIEREIEQAEKEHEILLNKSHAAIDSILTEFQMSHFRLTPLEWRRISETHFYKEKDFNFEDIITDSKILDKIYQLIIEREDLELKPNSYLGNPNCMTSPLVRALFCSTDRVKAYLEKNKEVGKEDSPHISVKLPPFSYPVMAGSFLTVSPCNIHGHPVVDEPDNKRLISSYGPKSLLDKGNFIAYRK